MNPNKKVKILLISEIQPISGTASSELLQRHLDRVGVSYEGIDETHPALCRGALNRLILKVLSWFSESLRQCYVESIEPIFKSKKIANTIGEKNLDVVLSLAHGRLGLHAWRVGKRLGIPVVTIFHDWWPEMMCSYRGNRDLCIRAIERDFINAQKNSDLALAVCPGMAKNLIYSKKVEVLYPIPDDSIEIQSDCKTHRPLRVVYTGSLWKPYGEMLMKLAVVLQDETDIALKIHGDSKYIPQQKRDQLLGDGTLEDYIYGDQYKKRVTLEAEVLLAVMGGDAGEKIRMTTSFPSKVANYFQTGNGVVLWALPGSSLNEFAYEYDYPWLVESDSPKDIANLLKQMAADPVLVRKARLDALRIRQQVFDAVKIQQQFEAALQKVII